MTSRSSRKTHAGGPARAGSPSHEATASHAHPRQHPRASHGEDDERDSGRPSKSQLKREMDELQQLGVQLLELPAARLRELPIPAELIEAVELAQRIRNSREGLRRQRQFIGKLMRDIDPEPLRDALSLHGSRHRAEVAAMHAAEHWRDRLLADPQALAEFRQRHPGADDALATLLDAARGEIAQGKPGRRIRELYRRLRDALIEESSELPGTEGSERTERTAR